MRWLILLGLILVATAACMSRYYIPTNRFELTNETGQVIDELTVTVSGTSFTMTNLQTGAIMSRRFVTSQDESKFDIRGRMNDGTLINDFCGYVLQEESFQTFRIAIRPDGMVSCRY